MFSHNELNMRQRNLIDLLKDYDYKIFYHPNKGNMIADALSQKESAMWPN